MTIPQPATPIRQGADDSSKQVYERLDVYIQPLVKDRSHEAPEPVLPQYHHSQGNDPNHQQQYVHHNYQAHPQYASVPGNSSGAASTDPVTGSNSKISRTKKGSRSRLHWLVSILAAVCAALIAATITGVAVWKATEFKGSLGTCEGGGGGGGRGGPGASPPAEDMPTGGGPRKAIRPASGLAAIGWRVKDETFIQLVYQDPDDNLRTSWFSSLWSNWTAPRIVPLVNKDAHQPKSGTPFAENEWEAQNQMNYLSPTGIVLGYNFRLVWPLGLPDSITQKSYSASPSSNLASLWPYNFYQADSEIRQVQDASAANVKLEGLSDAAGATPLLALPVGATRNPEELRLFYRNGNGTLSLFERDSRGSSTGNSGALAVDIPAGAGLGGFATARESSGPGINTFVLWQDALQRENGGIRVMSQTDGEGDWRGPVSDPVFSCADVNTRIACVNEGMGAVNNDATQTNVRLSNSRDLNRCYFQAEGGRLKQVRHDGKKWIDLGFVPM
ncbi:hypothetical protein MCOR12_002624 [Pyricularia oryzae]|nr:hypothetical protein MCOR12_002624 [Pyricularia oryzae]